tara:strand:+ start:6254 stop:6664 length:411 start_codon:yes stop_codon:yes gene_type:complete
MSYLVFNKIIDYQINHYGILNLDKSEKMEIKKVCNKFMDDIFKELNQLKDEFQSMKYMESVDDWEDVDFGIMTMETYKTGCYFFKHLCDPESICFTPRDFWRSDTGEREYIWRYINRLPKRLSDKVTNYLEFYNRI